MGGDDYLDQVVTAAEEARADQKRDLGFLDAFDLSQTRGEDVIRMEPPWVEARNIRGPLEDRHFER
jgi:hypothetical protein